MKFRKKKNQGVISFVILGVLMAGIITWAKNGGTDGGGGSAVKCEVKPEVTPMQIRGKTVLTLTYDKKLADEIALSHGRQYQLTDLWEAENGYGPFQNHKLKMLYDDKTPVKFQIEDALVRLEKINPEFGGLIRRYVELVQRHVQPIPKDSYVLPPQDTDIRYMRKGCAPIGLGAYSDRENNLVIDPDVWKALSKIDKAAFFMHEAIYKALRDTENARDSWKTRRLVGFLFSAESFSWQQAFQ